MLLLLVYCLRFFWVVFFFKFFSFNSNNLFYSWTILNGEWRRCVYHTPMCMQTSKYRAITFWHYFYVVSFFHYSIRLNLDNITLPFALNELCGMHWLACTSYINPLLLLFSILFSNFGFCFIHSFCVHIYFIYCIYYIVVKTMTWTRVPVILTLLRN